jgi:predicted HNH restriction endonuclease
MVADIPIIEIEEVIANIGEEPFSTKDFIDRLQQQFPATWRVLENEYGPGGKGSGARFTAYSRVAQMLKNHADNQKLFKLDFRDAPAGWGSRIIQYWSVAAGHQLFPDQIGDEEELWEGAVSQILVNRYERDTTARKLCIEHHGAICKVCRFDFGATYGVRGKGFIHVHHIVPISQAGKRYKVDPITDLIPVCPNCHAMIHSKAPELSIDELRRSIRGGVLLSL